MGSKLKSELFNLRLQFAKFSEIISSDLYRAKETTKEILTYHRDTPVDFDGRLREKNAGVFEGKKLIEYKKEAMKNGGDLRNFIPEGGESWKDVLKRSTEFFNDLIIKYVKKDFVFEILEKETDEIKNNENNENNVNNLNVNLSKTSNTNTNPNKNPKKFSLVSMITNKFRKLNTITPSKNINNQNDNTNKIKKSTTFQMDNTISKGKDNTELKKLNTMVDIQNKEIDYLSIDFNKLFTNNLYINYISKIYRGYDQGLNFPRVLLISHTGFIMELMNSIRLRKDIRIKFINDSKPSSLYIIKIYCINCGALCYSKDNNCRLNYDVILYNNVDHFNIIQS